MGTEVDDFDEFCENILDEMRKSKEDMIKDGIWTDKTTFEELSHYASRHCRLTELDNIEGI